MIDKTPGAPGEFTTIIGADATLKGELVFEKGVRVDGVVEGKVASKGQLAVSQGGRVQAEVHASSVLVDGDVVGNLVASDRIELRKSAKVKGDIRASKLLVAEGATFVGHCSVGAEVPPAAVPAPAAAPGINRLLDKDVLPRK